MANLLKRDEKELMGKESIGSSVYNEFGAQESKEADEESFPEAFHSAGAALALPQPWCLCRPHDAFLAGMPLCQHEQSPAGRSMALARMLEVYAARPRKDIEDVGCSRTLRGLSGRT